MKEKEAAVRAAVAGKDKKKHRLRRAAIISAAAVFVIALALALVHFCYWPLQYLWVKFSNPDVAAAKAGELRVHFVDVGQGDAVIVELPDGKSMLIDGGNESYASKSALLRYANALGVRTFDYLLLTHPDEDHAGGLDEALKCFGAEKAFIPYILNYAADSSYADFLDAAADTGCETEISRTFLTVLSEDKDDFYYMMFLSPFEAGVPGSFYDEANAENATDTDVNNASAVLWLEYAGRSILFTGDITEEAEAKLVGDYEILGNECFKAEEAAAWGETVTLAPALDELDFLKAAHHGSAGSSSERFLRLTSPECAFIGVGAGNSYGHPAQETVGRLAGIGAEIYRTDELGSIVLTVRADGTYAIDYIGRA